MAQFLSGALSRMATAAVVAGTGASFLMYNVEPGHRAIIFDRFRGGIQKEVMSEGTHFLIPGIQKPIFMDVRTRPRTIKTHTGTKDLQNVSLSLRVLSKPRVEALPKIYKELSIDYDERVLPSIGNEVLKSVVAQYNADQLLTQRDKVSLEIRENLTTRAGEFNILVEDVSITHLNFSSDFSKAIEDKQVAQQQAERAKFVVMKAEQEKLAKIIKSEGDAKAAELVSKALIQNGRGLIELRKIEAATEIANTLARSRNITYLPSSGSGSNLLLNVGGR